MNVLTNLLRHYAASQNRVTDRVNHRLQSLLIELYGTSSLKKGNVSCKNKGHLQFHTGNLN